MTWSIVAGHGAGFEGIAAERTRFVVWREHASRRREPIPIWRRVDDLPDEICIDIACADPAERHFAGCKIACSLPTPKILKSLRMASEPNKPMSRPTLTVQNVGVPSVP
jgi:hypothetical protein